MADNFNFSEGTGRTGAADEIGGVLVPRVKMIHGADGVNDGDVSESNPLPTQLRDSDGTDVGLSAKLGSVTEAAPASDTASSGLNGRLQRIAQRITSLIAIFPAALTGSGNFKVSLQESNASQAVTVASLPLPTGAATEATLATRLSESDFDAKTGSLTEAAPASDTASSGLNGRLQRIAQRITSLIGQVPAALGQTTKSGSMSVTVASDDDLQGKIGSLTEAAPASDTASSGLNGRLQRIAQRITSLIALFPTALGQSTMANSFRVVIASDQSAVSVQGAAAQDATISGNPVPVGMRASTATPSAMSADGDVVYPWATRNGAQVIAGDIVDDAAFTAGTNRVVPAGFMADETSTDSVDENDAGIARMTLDRKQIVTEQPHTAGGLTMHKTVSAASTNATTVKASPGKVYSIQASNVNSSPRYLKLYNKASNPTVGSDTTVKTLIIPGNSNGAGTNIVFPTGIEFTLGIAFALTTEATDAGTTGVAASEIVVNIDYK